MSAPERFEAAGAALSVWRDAPSLNGLRTAALGAFSCSTPELGAALIAKVMGHLRQEGFAAIIGPMDGDTWSAYRFVIESDGSAPFLMEPSNPAFYPAAFEQAGFNIVSRYVSAEGELRGPGGSIPDQLILRSFDLSRAQEELSAIYAVSEAAFASNAFYKPIAAEKFIASYTPVLGVINPDLVLLAETPQGELKGFLFAVANFAEGKKPARVILKTYASQVKGLGSALVAEFYRRAAAKGFERVIHALMHEDNLSLKHSHNVGGRIFRRYALWGRVL